MGITNYYMTKDNGFSTGLFQPDVEYEDEYIYDVYVPEDEFSWSEDLTDDGSVD